ncbi:uncharacterized protein cubi_00409 [Cryptosporidium ubiquitum]|uniref:Uncharacterized protein n=1 Tax=Cryptosporidium ubiquitum TaxID=857276 RepID=A0A1J4MDW4_9CRYT|nr:uncharacterized protein cubi_00409 [Cryptosporidium ubiquitum]OII72414.1 hypothetical protein cubi_00409 [Cryptosporidium ubiquitum]
MEDGIGVICGKEGDYGDKLVNKYDVLSYIDSISPEEMQYANKLVKDELSSVLSGLKNEGEKKEKNYLEKKKAEIEFNKREEQPEIEDKTMGKIKRISSEIQYNYITRVNLQLLKEFGDEAWDDQVKKLKSLKQKFQEEQNNLKKCMKQISLNRKKKQLEFRENQLGPLLDDLKRIQNENNSLVKTLLKIRKENRK